MSNNQRIRWGIIGCGAVTEVKSGPAYQQTDGFDLVAVMRRDGQAAKSYAERHGVPSYYSDADALINDDNIDAVYIATPPDSHELYALKVAQAGKICCIEKPLAPSYQDCVAICDAFASAGLPLFVAYYRRSLPRFVKVKSLLESGVIGDARQINWQFSKAASELDLSGAYNWRTDKLIAPGGYFDDLASHGLDLFAFLLGDIKRAKGIGLNQQGLYSALDSIAACWQHASGVTGSACWNFASYSRIDEVTILGRRGEIRFSVFGEQPITVVDASGEQQLYIDNPAHIQRYHVQNIRAQLVSGVPHPSTGVSASHTAWVMEQILKGAD
ncbi:Gfo/Idh/MocA family protein [Aliagarivorans marinus]|uniref:Gfo/Idh/MocA family protein n=1 Tax=Aliagarivorans marinus TaxID=561965 RepID=UPI000422839F|nr:Gfo/Idh/MocA family oxidoreductase [Aliagarivorans marinus]